MNMLGIATLDLVEHLRSITKGWRIEPMVQQQQTDVAYVELVKPQPRESLTNFFVDWMSKWNDDTCYIKVKIRNKPLRFIGCHFDEVDHPRLTLSYWHGEGWKQNQVRFVHRSLRNPKTEFDYNHCLVFKMGKIVRVIKGKRNRGKLRPGTKSLIQIDCVELEDPTSAGRVAKFAAATIAKSYTVKIARNFSAYRGRLAIVLDGNDFTYDAFSNDFPTQLVS